MLLLLIFTLSFFFCYFLLLLLYSAGLLSMKGPVGEEPAAHQEITVVIPFRNERTGLPGILADLQVQSYPAHLFSVILVNDHSNDGSDKLVASLVGDKSGFTCLDLPKGQQGKKEAIAFALSGINTPWVLQTDADCRLGPRFISSHMHYLSEHPSDLVAGMVTSKGGQGGFLEAFERLDLLALNGTGAASFALGRPIMCSGANLLYSAALYRDTRIFDPAGRISSGDDMFLLIGARKLKKKLAFNAHIDSLVSTTPSASVKALIGQRIRWGAKSGSYGMADIQSVAALVMVVNLLMLAMPFWIFLQAEFSPWFLAGLGMKILADFMIIALTSFKTKQSGSLWWYIPVALVYPLYMLLVFAGLFKYRSTWKGRPV